MTGDVPFRTFDHVSDIEPREQQWHFSWTFTTSRAACPQMTWPRPIESAHAAGLTARQAEVLGLLAEGMTNSEIADELFVSHRTVENHVSAVLMKLDVATREAAVSAARERGMLASDVRSGS